MLTGLLQRFLISLSFFCLLVGEVALAVPPIVVPMNPNASITFYSRGFVPNPLDSPQGMFSLHLDKMKFDEVKVHKGQELKIDSLVLCENTLASFAGLTRGTDAPQLGEIQGSIDTQDREKFLKLVLEMARLRRHAENREEWDQITRTVRGNRAHWNAYLFKTDFVVVTAKPEVAEINATETTYFVPIEEILSGAGEIDVHSAKLAILQSMSLKVLESFQGTENYTGFRSEPEIRAELADLSKSLNKICELKNHEFIGEAPVGCLITDLGFLQCAGRDKKLSDADQSLLKLRKQVALFQFVKRYFPELPGLEKIDALTRRENFQVSCDDRETLFLGLYEDESDGE